MRHQMSRKGYVMIVVSIDIETTGLKPTKNGIIQVGACVFNLLDPFDPDECKKGLWYLDEPNQVWDQQAIVSNAHIIDKMLELKRKGETENVMGYAEFLGEFTYFLNQSGVRQDKGFTVTGKNYMGFDHQFLCSNIPGWANSIKIKHRSIDVASHFWMPGDTALPTLQECLERAGISRPVSHTALDDAIDVAELTHIAMSKKS